MPFYVYTDVVTGVLVLIMSHLTSHDPDHAEKDATWLQWVRHVSFVGITGLLINDIACAHSEFSKDLLIWAGEVAVVINVAALCLRRAPPDKGSLNRARPVERRPRLVPFVISVISEISSRR